MQLLIGRIGKAHGIRGEVNVGIRTDDPEERFEVGAMPASIQTVALIPAPVPTAATMNVPMMM